MDFSAHISVGSCYSAMRCSDYQSFTVCVCGGGGERLISDYVMLYGLADTFS